MILLLAGTSLPLGHRVAVAAVRLFMHRLEGLYLGFELVQVSHVATCWHSLKAEKMYGLSPEISSNFQ